MPLLPKAAQAVLMQAVLMTFAFPGSWCPLIRAEQTPTERTASLEVVAAGQISAYPSDSVHPEVLGEGQPGEASRIRTHLSPPAG